MLIPRSTKVFKAPTAQAGSITFSGVTDIAMRINWQRGNGVECIVLVSENEITDEPQRHTSYTANAAFGSGSQIGSAYVVYKGKLGYVDVTGLTENTTYYVKVFELNKTGSYVAYNKETGNSGNQATQDVIYAPTTQATDASFNGDRQIKWTNGNGLGRIVVMKEGSAVDALPVDGVTYTANKAFGSGSELGTGNFIVYAGTGAEFNLSPASLAFNTSYHFRVFEYNLSAGSPLYFTDSATGNPNSKLTISQETWYLHHDPIATNARYAANVDEISYIASKAYSLGFCETSTEYLLFLVGDNQLDTPSGSDLDQTFLKYKSKSDGLPFTEGWTWYADETGEPIPVLPFGGDDPVQSAQQWLATPTVFADDNIVAYYSANGPFNSTRYSCGRAHSTDGGRTWTKDAIVLPQGSNKNYFQPHHAFYDADQVCWYIKGSVITNSETEGRATSANIYKSTDGATGLAFELIASNIYDGTDICVGGFGLEGPMWKVGSRFHWYAEAEPVDNYISKPNTDTTPVYTWLSKQVVEVSAPIDFSEPPIIERIVYEIDHQGALAIYPASQVITHDSKEHIIVSCFLWKLEGRTTAFRQVSLDTRVLSKNAYTGNVIGNNAYPDYITKFYRMHQPQLDDTYQSTTLYPKEVLSNQALTIVGSPQQYALGFFLPNSTGYIQAASWTHDTQYFGVKVRGQRELRFAPDNVDRIIVEKEGTFKVFLSQSLKLEIWVYGQGGGIKKLQSPLNLLNYGVSSFFPDVLSTVIGFVARYNGVDDIDITMLCDYEEITHTVLQNDTFTNIAQTANPIKFGSGTDAVNNDRPQGGTLIFEGSTGATKANWIKENII